MGIVKKTITQKDKTIIKTRFRYDTDVEIIRQGI